MDTFIKKVPRSTTTVQEPKTKKIIIKKTTKKKVTENAKSIMKIGGETTKIDKETVLGTKGYSVNKTDFTEDQINQLKV